MNARPGALVKLRPKNRLPSRTMKTLVLTFWLVAVAMFVAAAPPPPPRTVDAIRRPEVASGTVTNVTAQGDGKALKRGDKKRTDVPRDSFSTEEKASIFRIANEYRPEGLSIPTYVLQRGPLPDMAVVRITTRRGDREEVVCVLTLKKEGKEWKVESCAR